MLICRQGEWRVESDGYLSSAEWVGLEGLRTVAASLACDAEIEAARLAERARMLKRRAWRRGYDAGRRAALDDLVAGPVSASFTARCLRERLAGIVLAAVVETLGEVPVEVALSGRLRRCLEASCAQQVLSVRVSASDHEAAHHALRGLAQALNVPAFTVLPDAGLSPRSLIVETECGVIDGSLGPQLRALEQSTQAAVRTVLDEYRYIDDASARQFDAVRHSVHEVLDALAAPGSGASGGDGS